MFRFRFSAALLIAMSFGVTASAQQAGGDDQGSTGNTGTGTGDSNFGTLNPDEAFSAVERGDTVGATSETGTGFSDLSVANGGGGGLGGLGGFGGFGGGGLGGLGGLFGGGFNNGNNQSSQPAIRTRLRSAVQVAARTPSVVQRSAMMRFRNLATRPELRGVGVRMEGRKAILTGQVGSERDRRMSELLMQLEPGVREIDNQLTVAPQ